MTPAEQYRTLLDRLQVLEDSSDPWVYSGPPLPQNPPQPVEYPPDQNRYPPKALGVFPTTKFHEDFKIECLAILEKLSQHVTDPLQKQIFDNIKVKVTTDPADGAAAEAWDYTIVIDYGEFNNAPENVLTWLLGHEAGHVVLNHVNKVTPQQSQQEELDADDFATKLVLSMGITKAPVFAWLHRQKDELGQTEYEYMQNAMRDPIMTNYFKNKASHPTYDRRFDNAAKKGLKLSKANTDQIDRLLAHMSRTA